MTRGQVLESAYRCVTGERPEDYGTPENHFEVIARLWTVYLRQACPTSDGKLTVAGRDVALMMALLKIARIRTGTATDDSYVDLAGYAACGSEINSKTDKGEI